jgi:hypothetical protein
MTGVFPVIQAIRYFLIVSQAAFNRFEIPCDENTRIMGEVITNDEDALLRGITALLMPN